MMLRHNVKCAEHNKVNPDITKFNDQGHKQILIGEEPTARQTWKEKHNLVLVRIQIITRQSATVCIIRYLYHLSLGL